ncbi:uncharacterized protein LOC143376594 [Andrena cerasifolii]|uniref:uncharacterized protein LOC143376594 n=1 Tax=Andrena cerasifolii TaxID=2819439 RepID=UPI0040382074
MGKRTARSFCELGTVIFLLYFAKVPSATSAPIEQSILGVMNADRDLRCDVPTFLYDSNITQTCSNLTYPGESLKFTVEKKNTFLCLAFYDTWYKACDPSQILKPFTNTSTFYSYIQKFFPKGGEESQTMFCENVKDVVFSHKKLQPWLSQINLKRPKVCDRMCFNVDETFNPFCAILAWSKSIDDNKKRDVVPKGNTATEVDQRVEPKVVGPELNKGSRQGTTGKEISKDTNDAKNNPHISPAVITKSEPVIETLVPKIMQKSSEISVSKPSPITNSDPVEKHETSNNNSPLASKDQEEAPPNINPANVSDNSRKPSEAIHSSTNNVDNGVAESGKDANDDIRTSTLSENTQDHDPSVSQGEWNPSEEDQNDDQAIETGDQRPSILEVSGRKDTTSSFHSIRPDDESHFITYFTIISMVSIAAYIGYHNKQKILAIVLEGRRARNSRGRRRPSTANYRKLDCTLEEAVTSQCNANVTHVIY